MRNGWLKRAKITSVDFGGILATVAACILFATGVLDWRLFLVFALAKFTFIVHFRE